MNFLSNNEINKIVGGCMNTFDCVYQMTDGALLAADNTPEKTFCPSAYTEADISGALYFIAEKFDQLTNEATVTYRINTSGTSDQVRTMKEKMKTGLKG